MDYLPTRPDPKKLSSLIWKHFDEVPKPTSHFTSLLPYYMEEFIFSENIDFEIVTLDALKGIYESNTFYSASGYKYRFPRMFSLLCRLGTEAAHLDFVSAFFGVNVCCEHPNFFETYTVEQKYCVWLTYDCLDLHFNAIHLFDHDAKLIMEQKDCSLEIVDRAAIETLSTNLFGIDEPPLDAIKAFSAAVCSAQ